MVNEKVKYLTDIVNNERGSAVIPALQTIAGTCFIGAGALQTKEGNYFPAVLFYAASAANYVLAGINFSRYLINRDKENEK